MPENSLCSFSCCTGMSGGGTCPGLICSFGHSGSCGASSVLAVVAVKNRTMIVREKSLWFLVIIGLKNFMFLELDLAFRQKKNT